MSIVKFGELQTKVFDKKVRNILELKKAAKFASIKHLIVPFLSDGDLFPEFDEELEELVSMLDETEAAAILEDERPDALTYDWNGFTLSFLLDWGRANKQIEVSDYLTNYMVSDPDITKQEIIDTALNNLYASDIYVVNIKNDIIFMGVKTNSIPDYSASILMCSEYLKKVREDLGNMQLWVFPLFQEGIVLTTNKELASGGSDAIRNILKDRKEVEYFNNFSNRYFEVMPDGSLKEQKE